MNNDVITQLLPDALLERIRKRAAEYDSKNQFFTEDLAELKASGYLAACVPQKFHGAGLSLTDLSRAQRRLAAASPATALGVNMHLVWAAVSKILYDRDDHRLDWIFDEIVAGEIFTFGISEPGNDAVLMDAQTVAEATNSGYLLTGTKVFTTLSPVWTSLGVHAKTSDTGELLFGFVRRDGVNRDAVG